MNPPSIDSPPTHTILPQVLAALVTQLSTDEALLALFYSRCHNKYVISDPDSSPVESKNWETAQRAMRRHENATKRIRSIQTRAYQVWGSKADGITEAMIQRLFQRITTLAMAEGISKMLHRPKPPTFHSFLLATNNELCTRLSTSRPGQLKTRSLTQGDLTRAYRNFRQTDITQTMLHRIGMDYGSDGLLTDAAAMVKSGERRFTPRSSTPPLSLALSPPSTPSVVIRSSTEARTQIPPRQTAPLPEGDMEIDSEPGDSDTYSEAKDLMDRLRDSDARSTTEDHVDPGHSDARGDSEDHMDTGCSDAHGDSEDHVDTGDSDAHGDSEDHVDTGDSDACRPTEDHVDPGHSDAHSDSEDHMDTGDSDAHSDSEDHMDTGDSDAYSDTDIDADHLDPDYSEHSATRAQLKQKSSSACLCIESGFTPHLLCLLQGKRQPSSDILNADQDQSHDANTTRIKPQLFEKIAGRGTQYWALSPENFCRTHARLLASGIGLRSKPNNQKLFSRLQYIFEHLESLAHIKSDPTCEQWKWFQQAARTPSPTAAHGVFKYPVEMPKPRIDQFAASGMTADEIYTRVIGPPPTAPIADLWDADGSVVIPLFRWLGEKKLLGCTHSADVPCEHTGGLWSMIDLEFDMYEHHRAQGENPAEESVTSMGWLRCMWHGLIQQLIRQDPAYYAFYVLLRPDHAWRLISVPWYSKSTSAGAQTAFRHLDINIPRYLSRGRSANIIQGAVTLSDEDPANCTELLLGMHRQGLLQQWWERVEQRGLSNQNVVHRIASGMWTAADEADFGLTWQRQVCHRGDARISRPELPYGSTGPATQVRRTVLPWFIGIGEDHEQLDTHDAGTWSAVAASHRDLIPAERGTPGFTSVHRGAVPYAFPGAVHLQGLGAISDALVGRRRWTNTSVISELDVLFGADTHAAEVFIQQWRQRAAQAFLAAFQEVQRLEALYYGANSFFRLRGLV